MNTSPFASVRLKRISAVATTAMVSGFVTYAVIACYANGQTDDFGYFYRAARGMLEGRHLYAAAGGRYIYPPFLAFVFQPLALLSELPAASVWAIVSGAVLLAALLLAANEAARAWLQFAGDNLASARWIIAGAVALLLADKIHTLFILGQTDALMLLGFACALRWVNRRPLLAGIAVGAAANVKYLSLICVPYFILKRNVRAAASSLAAFCFFILLPVAEIGWAKLGQYNAIAFGGLARMMGFAVPNAGAKTLRVDWDRSLSWTSAAFRRTRSEGLPDSVAIVLVVLLFVAAMAVIWFVARANGTALFTARRFEDNPAGRATASLEWAVLVFLAVAFSPQTMSRHMLLMAIPLTVAVALAGSVARRSDRSLLLASIGLVLAGLSLPLGSLGFDTALHQWRLVSGASSCAFLLTLSIVWTGSRAIADRHRASSCSRV